MSRYTVEDWNRKHTLISVFLGLLFAAAYGYGYIEWIKPAEAVEQVEVPAIDLPVALTATEKENLVIDVPALADAPDMLVELEQLAATHGMQVVSVSDPTNGAATQATGSLVPTTYAVQLSSERLSTAEAFLAGIAENPRYMQVEGIRLKDGDPVRLDVSLTVYHRE